MPMHPLRRLASLQPAALDQAALDAAALDDLAGAAPRRQCPFKRATAASRYIGVSWFAVGWCALTPPGP
jgi:hypothetical protein